MQDFYQILHFLLHISVSQTGKNVTFPRKKLLQSTME